MKILVAVLTLFVAQMSYASPVRKAVLNCSFLDFVDKSGEVTRWEWTAVEFKIDLDSKTVQGACHDEEYCPFDGGSGELQLTTAASADESFAVISNGPSYTSNISPINIEGGNGDDMDIFMRVSFEPIDKNTMGATAIMTFADEGVNGSVSLPSSCSVTPVK